MIFDLVRLQGDKLEWGGTWGIIDSIRPHQCDVTWSPLKLRVMKHLQVDDDDCLLDVTKGEV